MSIADLLRRRAPASRGYGVLFCRARYRKIELNFTGSPVAAEVLDLAEPDRTENGVNRTVLGTQS